MKRWEIINTLIAKNSYKNYLEIGIQNRVNFNQIKASRKFSVDPDKNALPAFIMTSDEFFEKEAEKLGIKFDIIFIDGLHHSEQVIKDIDNSLKLLSENGSIVVHDCNPIKEEHQIVPRVSKIWNGDVWKAWVEIRSNRSALKMAVVDTDHGCGIIQRGSQKKLKISQDLNFSNFEKNREKWLNLISVKEFKKLFANGQNNCIHC